MAMTRSEITAKYDSVNSKLFTIKLNRKTDADILETIEKAESKQGFIKKAIRAYNSTCHDSNTVSVPFSDAALSMLTEKAEKAGVSVPNLVAVMVNEQLLRT